MARKFLPALRSKPHPAAAQQSLKVVLGDYYGALSAAGYWNSTRSRPWPVERAVAEGYERIIYVFRSVEAIAGQASRLPFRLRQAEDEVDEHPLYQILNHQANPMETGRQFRKRLGAQILLSKRGAFVEVTTARGGTPLRMDLLPPGRTRPVPGFDGTLIDHYETVRADGTRAEIPAEQVIWCREPHPLDPYSGVTPLEAAGMSAELDFFARMYNVQFLKNDARPGGVLAINGDMDPDEMDRIEDKFGRGPVEAGKLTVIAGDVSYVDSVVRPRDMQYNQLAANSKVEILTAFGVPESVLGYAADRTYANAGQEHTNFWVITMPPFMDLQITGFDSLSEPELEGFFDVSQVEALQAAEAAKRAEKREEFDKGLINVDEYREATGKEPFGMPSTRCLYINSGMTPVPTSPADEKAMAPALLPPEPAAGELPPGGGGEPPADSGDGGDSGSDNGGDNGDTGGEGAKSLPVAPAPPRPATRPRPRAAAAEPHLRLIHSCAVKAIAPPAGDSGGDESVPDAGAQARLEDAVAAALAALTRRWSERTIARLTSPKSRKGTRHWQPDLRYKADARSGNQALDASQATDGARWQAEAEQAVGPIVTAAAVAAATALAGDLAGDAAADVSSAVTSAAQTAADAVTAMVGTAAAGLAAKVAAVAGQTDQDGATMDEITTAVRGAMDRETAVWAPGVAMQAATATIAGARDGAAVAISNAGLDAGRRIIRVWRSRHDTKVRETHQTADGQTQPVGTPFVVGDSLLRYPGDPLGPPAQVINCFPADTPVTVPDGLVAAWRAPYAGSMVTVRTRSGRVLTGTPNHPVLTYRGWVALGSLNVGDDLIHRGGADAEVLPGGAPDIQHTPALIGEVFAALAKRSAPHRVCGSTVNFYGDRPAGDVHVVRAGGMLRLAGDAVRGKQRDDLAFPYADDSDLRLSPARFLTSAHLRAAASSVGGGNESLAVGGAGAGHAGVHGSRAVAQLRAAALQPSFDHAPGHPMRRGEYLDRLATLVPAHENAQVRHGDPVGALSSPCLDSPFTQPVVSGIRFYPTLPCERGEVLVAGEVATDEVVHISVAHDWFGHVYTLSTRSGIYNAGGIVTRNCRCVLNHKSVRTGQYVPTPAGQVTRHRAAATAGL